MTLTENLGWLHQFFIFSLGLSEDLNWDVNFNRASQGIIDWTNNCMQECKHTCGYEFFSILYDKIDMLKFVKSWILIMLLLFNLIHCFIYCHKTRKKKRKINCRFAKLNCTFLYLLIKINNQKWNCGTIKRWYKGSFANSLHIPIIFKLNNWNIYNKGTAQRSIPSRN